MGFGSKSNNTDFCNLNIIFGHPTSLVLHPSGNSRHSKFKDRERRTILLDWKGNSKMTNSKALDRQRQLLPHVFGEAVLE